MKKISTTLVLLLCGVIAFASDGNLKDGGGSVVTVEKVKKGMPANVVSPWRVPYRLTAGTLPHSVRRTYGVAANGLTANFSVQDGSAQKEVWKENFDDANALNAWTIDKGVDNQITFALKNASESFSTIDESNVTSLYIEGGYSMPKRTKGYATSGEITVPDNGRLHAYVSMSSNMSGYASLVIQISDDNFETVTDLWTSLDVTTTGRQWVPVDCDLAAFIGKTVKLRLYYGPGKGDYVGGSLADFYVDGMSITGVETIDQITVKTGERIQFADLSVGTPTGWLWSFPGGTPETSTERNPEVYYEKAGTYDVTLKVTDSEGADEVTKTAFVNVEGQTPVAGVVWPSEFRDYNTRMRMVAPLTPVTYKDNSELYPTSYMWTFLSEYEVTGSTIIPKVYEGKEVDYVHEKLNKYYVTHIVQNETGYDFVDDSVQVQFAGLVTNFQKNDTYHTNYTDGELTLPGANNMGITAWAEKISKPSQPVLMTAMYVNFTKASATEVTDQIAPVSFSLYTSENGVPGQRIDLLDTWTISELNYAMTNAGGSVQLELSKPYMIDDEVFVVIDGIPAKNDNLECAFAMAPLRDNGNTAYMLKNDEWRPFTGYFQAAPGGQTSLAVYPYFSYSVLFKADVDPETNVVTRDDTPTEVGKEAGTVAIPVFAYLGVAQYVESSASWCRFTGSPQGEYTVENVTVEYDTLPEGIDEREALLTITDGVQPLQLRVVQKRSAATGIEGVTLKDTKKHATAYDILGRRINSTSTQKGIYIIDGKKVVR